MEHLTDLLPRRRTSYRRVVPLADRTASQRRLAIAFLGFLVLLVALAGVVWFIGGLSHPNVAAVSNAQQAIQAATDDMAQVTNGNLLVNEPTRAHTILQDAWHQLTQATAFGAPASALADLKGRVSTALDQLYDVGYTTSQALLVARQDRRPPGPAGPHRGPRRRRLHHRHGQRLRHPHRPGGADGQDRGPEGPEGHRRPAPARRRPGRTS